MTTSPTTTAINAVSIESTRHIRTRITAESVTWVVAMISHFPLSWLLGIRSVDQGLVTPVTNVTQIISGIWNWRPVSRFA